MPFVPPMQKVDEVLPEASSGTPMPHVKKPFEYKPDIKVKTEFNEDIIQQSVAFPRQESLFNHIAKQILFLQEQGVQQALYKLGYLSPEQLLPLKDAYLAAKHNEGGVQRVMAELGRLFDEPAKAASEPKEKPKGPENEKVTPTTTKLGTFSEGGYMFNTKPRAK